MTSETPLTPQQENDALAAELALGLLVGGDEQAAVARLDDDAALAQSLREWQERLTALTGEITPVMPPARTWHGIRERLGHVQAVLIEDPVETLRPWWRGPAGILVGIIVIAVAIFLWLRVPPQL